MNRFVKWCFRLVAGGILVHGAGACLRPERIAGGPADTALMVKLNGVSQYIEIHGQSEKNPVLLFIHGGPAWPATPMIRSRNADLFRDVTVVSWDQRNCGKSLTDTTVPLSVGLYVSDAHELTQYLKERFHRKKIFIAGHSWGSVIGVKLAQQYPDDYNAYIGMGQVVNLRRQDAVAREELVRLAREAGDTATVKLESQIPFTVESGYAGGWPDMIRHRIALAGYRINDHDTVYENRAIGQYEDYRSLDWLTPVMRDGAILYEELMAVDFTSITDFKIPVFLMAGRYDFNASQPVVAKWFESINAPQKKFIWFENSGHSPQWEEPALFAAQMRKICRR
jgi:proline iminopeptidase